MKRGQTIFVLFCLLVLMAPIGSLRSSPVVTDSLSRESGSAAQAYRDRNFKESIRLYEEKVAEALSKGEESAQLYYNLGNAYFRDNSLGKAILNYERALLLDPGDGDIRHNLKFANGRVVDSITPKGTIIFDRAYLAVRNLLSSNSWAKVSIILFILSLCSIALYIFIRKLWVRKVGFYLAIILLLSTVLSNSFAYSQKRERQERNIAIIMVEAASFNASPDVNSNRLFELHEGTKVKIRNRDGDWYEVEIANGSVGWTRNSNIEII